MKRYFVVDNERSEVSSCSIILNITAQVWARFPADLRVVGGEGGRLEECGGWIQPKVILRNFETIGDKISYSQ